MANLTIKLPEIDEFKSLSAGFLLLSSLNGTLLTIDGTHIPIEAPFICPKDLLIEKDRI